MIIGQKKLEELIITKGNKEGYTTDDADTVKKWIQSGDPNIVMIYDGCDCGVVRITSSYTHPKWIHVKDIENMRNWIILYKLLSVPNSWGIIPLKCREIYNSYKPKITICDATLKEESLKPAILNVPEVYALANLFGSTCGIR